MKKKERILSMVLIILFLISPLTALGAEGGESFTPEELRDFFDDIIAIEMEEHKIPSLTLSVVHQGEVVFQEGYGYQNREESIPVNPETSMFRIGSTTKLFTWTAVMQLVEEGLLDLDEDVNYYLDFEIPGELPITLRHLMAHTPGFEDYMTEVFNLEEEEHRSLEDTVKETLPARVFNPGEVRAYSNYGVSLAGYIVQRVSGIPYEDYIEEHIFKPLGMNHSTVRQPLPKDLEEHLSLPYRWVEEEFKEARFEYVSEPAGSISSSGGDMAKFMLSYLEGGAYNNEVLLKPDTLEEMFSIETTFHEKLRGTSYGFLKAEYNGRETFHHPGGMMLYDTAMFLIPGEDLGFFISHSGGNYLINFNLFQDFLDRYFPEGEKEEIIGIPGTEHDAKRFVGEYYQNRRSFTTSDALLSLLFGTIRVEAGEGGNLFVHHLGDTHEFMEVEDGVYQNLSRERSKDYSGDFHTIVFGTDSIGKTMLIADGPMSYSRAAWYEGTNATLGIIGFSMITILASFIFWSIKGGMGLFKRKNRNGIREENIVTWARRVAYTQGLLAFIFVTTFLIGGEPDPVYGLPTQAYTNPSALMAMIDRIIPFLMILVTFGVVKFAIRLWIKGHHSILPRIHYSVFSLASVMLIWVFYYWNII